MVEVIAKIAEIAAKGAEKLAEAAGEVKAKVVNLDRPLNVSIEESFDGLKTKELYLKDIDKPLNSDIPFRYEGTSMPRSPESNDGFRALTEKEKQELRENTSWPDKAEGIQGCQINKDGVLKYPCRNGELAGTANPITGVEYEKRIVEINGYKVEVVVPKFDSVFDAKLSDKLWEAKDREQFKECNKQLYDAIQKDPELAKKFTSEQIEQIKDGIDCGGAPDGYTWHHDAETGKMQLVDTDMHSDSRHTGGKSLWGGGNGNR